MTRISAVTFDFWNTLVHEGPSGLFAPRLTEWERILGCHGVSVSRTALREAHKSALLAYQRAWQSNEQFVSVNACDHVLAEIGLTPAVHVRDALIESFETAGRASEVALVPGALECLRTLRDQGRKLGVVCDIGLTPSVALVTHLERLSCGGLFDVLVWSDKTGIYKPDARAFRSALDALGIAPEHAVHVGDRTRTDIAGAAQLGMHTIRFAGVYDDPETDPAATATVTDLRVVPDVVSKLEAES